MKTLMIATVVGAMALSGAAQAGDWVLTGYSNDTATGLDRSSIRRSGNTVSLWSIKATRDRRTVAGMTFDYYVTRQTVDCVNQTVHTRSSVYYLLDSSSSVYTLTSGSTEDIVPDTVMDSLAEAVCGERAAGFGHSTANEFAQWVRANWPG